jgi:hypothetical protein
MRLHDLPQATQRVVLELALNLALLGPKPHAGTASQMACAGQRPYGRKERGHYYLRIASCICIIS